MGMSTSLEIGFLAAIIIVPCLLSARNKVADWLAAIAVAALLCMATIPSANAGEAYFAIITPEMAVGIDSADARHCGGKPSAALFMYGEIVDQTCAIARDDKNLLIQFNNHEFPYSIPYTSLHKGK